MTRKLRIAQVAPLLESVPPKQYGGTERIVSYLTEELVQRGHDVTLFASGDSQTSAELCAVVPRSLRLDPGCQDWIPHHLLMLEAVLARASKFDVIHFHIDLLHLPLVRRLNVPSVTTLHGRLDLPDLGPLYRDYCDVPVVSISMSQREPLPWARWAGNVYHGLPLDLYRFSESVTRDYLAFLGRFSPEKGPALAIEIAKASGIPLKIAAKVDKADQHYFETEIRPMLDHPLIEFVGEIGDDAKQPFLSNAKALLFPIDWPEPFGLVMIEAMACGTPVIARACGAVPEVMSHGETGYLFETCGEGVDAIRRLDAFDRRRCRRVFEERFSSEQMAARYLQVYGEVMKALRSDERVTRSLSVSGEQRVVRTA